MNVTSQSTAGAPQIGTAFAMMGPVLVRAAEQARIEAEANRPGAKRLGAANSRTQAIRDALKEFGRSGTAEISARTGLPRAVIGALMKGDIKAGRITVCHGTPVEYEWAFLEDAELEQDLQRARDLLVKHGYTVIEPEDGGA